MVWLAATRRWIAIAGFAMATAVAGYFVIDGRYQEISISLDGAYVRKTNSWYGIVWREQIEPTILTPDSTPPSAAARWRTATTVAGLRNFSPYYRYGGVAHKIRSYRDAVQLLQVPDDVVTTETTRLRELLAADSPNQFENAVDELLERSWAKYEVK